MNTFTPFLEKYKNVFYILILIICLLPSVTPPVSLFAGIIFAISCGQAFPAFNKKMSKYLLQGSVVGLGFGMNVRDALASGRDGMLFTIVSVAGTLILGSYIAKKMNIDKKTGYLISSGTAICGGSAIAAVGPIAKANDSEMSVSLATIFILNAIALFIFPVLGHILNLSQHQFGLWSAIAIHDTSSVVGAGATYGEEALKVATTVKLTRALWIIPLSIFTIFYFKAKGEKIAVPWFIFLFILAMTINTYLHIPAFLSENIVLISRKVLTLTLFFIGAGLSRSTLKAVGPKPLILGVILWILIAAFSLMFIYISG